MTLAFAACGDTALLTAPGGTIGGQDENPKAAEPGTIVLNFKSDIGVLNYAYALEQLEAAFYIEVTRRGYRGMTDPEERVLADVRDHEIAHRDFFRAALGAQRIPDLVPDFSSVNFADRSSVLNTARVFEDLGVAAYNGAARYLENTTYLVVAGKIVSVEARHAATIRDLLQPKTGYFAPKPFDDAFDPNTVIKMADPFITTKIIVVNA